MNLQRRKQRLFFDMKKIGLVDYYVSEWHANNYPTWIREISGQSGGEFEVAYAWAELETSPLDGVTTAQWCANMGVAQCETIAELCEKSDAIIVLAPSNPETHLRYAEAVLPFGKPTYIDKTFAPNEEIASKIFELAKQHDTPIFSTSALRFAEELKKFADVQNLIVTGGGSNLEEYVIHMVELALILLQDRVSQVTAIPQGRQRLFRLLTERGKNATLIFTPRMPFILESESSDAKMTYAAVKSDFFRCLMRTILQFFETGDAPVDPSQTLEVMRVRDAILSADFQAEDCVPRFV